ncbi:MAG: helix-turn-helix domain-containing protein [Oscillospiraceae bacterium]|nr:helix-turn-helix domain-containing protein [Oscillospiraceae bacterium]
MSIRDHQLIKKIQNGDKQALNELIRHYYDEVYKNCISGMTGMVESCSFPYSDRYPRQVANILCSLLFPSLTW